MQRDEHHAIVPGTKAAEPHEFPPPQQASMCQASGNKHRAHLLGDQEGFTIIKQCT